MKRPPLKWLIVGGVALTTACATLATVFGQPAEKIKVPHQKHTENDVECLTCHEDIFDVEVLGKSTFPAESKCLECHREWKDDGKCGMCHTRTADPGTYPSRGEPELVLSHQKHLAMEEIDEKCDVCHKVLPEPTRLDTPSPPMAVCTDCHRHGEQFAAGTCEPCHTDLSRYPLRPVTAFSHRGNYLQEHAQDARARANACSTCHEQRFCADCHTQTVANRIEELVPERIDRAYIHRGDYQSRHMFEARADGALCMRCHGTTFCSDCHAQRGLTAGGTRPGNPHPPGYADPNNEGGFHGTDARMNVVSCAGCHDQGASSNCVECHRVGAFGGNPHPPSWRGRTEEIDRNAMCLYCHR